MIAQHLGELTKTNGLLLLVNSLVRRHFIIIVAAVLIFKGVTFFHLVAYRNSFLVYVHLVEF